MFLLLLAIEHFFLMRFLVVCLWWSLRYVCDGIVQVFVVCSGSNLHLPTVGDEKASPWVFVFLFLGGSKRG